MERLGTEKHILSKRSATASKNKIQEKKSNTSARKNSLPTTYSHSAIIVSMNSKKNTENTTCSSWMTSNSSLEKIKPKKSFFIFTMHCMKTINRSSFLPTNTPTISTDSKTV